MTPMRRHDKILLLRLLLPAVLLILPGPPARAETSILLSLMQNTQAVVQIEAETGVVYGEARPVVNPETGEMFIQSKVRPVVHTRRGTGMIIDPAGFIVTNAHTVRQAGVLKVTLYDGRQLRAEIVHIAPAEDLALIRVRGEAPLPAIRLADSDQVRINDKVFSIGGSPLLRNTISEGTISAIGVPRGQRRGDNVKFLRVTFNIYEGDSGSPLFDENGYLLGIMLGAKMHQDKTAYAIPSNTITQTFIAFLES